MPIRNQNIVLGLSVPPSWRGMYWTPILPNLSVYAPWDHEDAKFQEWHNKNCPFVVCKSDSCSSSLGHPAYWNPGIDQGRLYVCRGKGVITVQIAPASIHQAMVHPTIEAALGGSSWNGWNSYLVIDLNSNFLMNLLLNRSMGAGTCKSAYESFADLKEDDLSITYQFGTRKPVTIKED